MLQGFSWNNPDWDLTFRFSHPLGEEESTGSCLGRAPVWVATVIWGGKARASTPAAHSGATSGRCLCLSVEWHHQVRWVRMTAVLTIWALLQISAWRFSHIPYFSPTSVPECRGWGKRTVGNSSIGFVFSVLNFTLKNKIASSRGGKTSGIRWKVLL